MSKFAMFQELANLKGLATRRSLLSRTAIVLGMATLLAYAGRDGFSYLTTASRLVTEKVRSNVPVEFEIERARTLISDLVPEVRKNMLVIAQEEVAVKDLNQEVGRVEQDLGRQREQLLALRSNIENEGGNHRIGARAASTEEVRTELARRFSRFQTAEATLAAKKQLLVARQRSLDASRAKVENMLNAKRDMELQIENLDARLKTQQSQAVATSTPIDTSQVARCQKLVGDLRVRLEVADRLLATRGEPLDSYPVSIELTDDIGDQIDRYFASHQKQELTAMVDNRR